MQKEPKTIDDYKDVVKILKLKIIKQNKKVQELQLKNKNYEEQINSITIRGDDFQVSSRVMADMEKEVTQKQEQRELEMNTPRGRVEVMNLFIKGITKIGITPQSVFRIADFGYKNYVQSDYFREVLSKMKLGLSQKQISCLIFIFDEFYSGFISRQDYYNSLHAYKVGVENNHHPFIQESIFKLSQMLHSDKVNLIKFYEEMESQSKTKAGNSTVKKTIELNLFSDQIKKSYGGKISEREIVASFNAIDLESVGYLEKNNFLYCITSYINKLLSGDEQFSRKSQPQWNNNTRSQYLQPNVDTVKATPKKPEKVNDNLNEQSRYNNPYTPNGILERLQTQFKQDLYTIYEQIMMDPLSHRLTLKTFKKHLLSLNSQFPSSLLSDLYKEIDAQTKGSIYFNELINYYLSNSSDNEMIFRLIGKSLLAQDLDSEKFWYMFGFNSQSQITKNKFMEILKKNFETKDEKLWQNFWNVFDKGRGTCNVGAVIKTFKKYELQ